MKPFKITIITQICQIRKADVIDVKALTVIGVQLKFAMTKTRTLRAVLIYVLNLSLSLV